MTTTRPQYYLGFVLARFIDVNRLEIDDPIPQRESHPAIAALANRYPEPDYLIRNSIDIDIFIYELLQAVSPLPKNKYMVCDWILTVLAIHACDPHVSDITWIESEQRVFDLNIAQYLFHSLWRSFSAMISHAISNGSAFFWQLFGKHLSETQQTILRNHIGRSLPCIFDAKDNTMIGLKALMDKIAVQGYANMVSVDGLLPGCQTDAHNPR